MNSSAENQAQFRNYLLGTLPPEEMTGIERRLLADGDFYEQLLIAEDELVDQYLADRLTISERERFEIHFLSTPERRKKLRFGKSFWRYLHGDEVSRAAGKTSGQGFAWSMIPLPSFLARRPLISVFATAGLCVGLVIVSWIALSQRSRQNQSFQAGQTLAVVLVPGLARDGGTTQRVDISPAIEAVEFELQSGRSDYQTYNVDLLRETTVVWSHTGLKPMSKNNRQIVLITVSARLLPPADYQIKLNGASGSADPEFVNSYNFRVVSP